MPALADHPALTSGGSAPFGSACASSQRSGPADNHRGKAKQGDGIGTGPLSQPHRPAFMDGSLAGRCNLAAVIYISTAGASFAINTSPSHLHGRVAGKALGAAPPHRHRVVAGRFLQQGSERAAGLSSSGGREGMLVAKYCTGTMLPIRERDAHTFGLRLSPAPCSHGTARANSCAPVAAWPPKSCSSAGQAQPHCRGSCSRTEGQQQVRNHASLVPSLAAGWAGQLLRYNSRVQRQH